jgi:hypothetical protein
MSEGIGRAAQRSPAQAVRIGNLAMPCHGPENRRRVLAHGGLVTPVGMGAAPDPNRHLDSSMDVKPPL